MISLKIHSMVLYVVYTVYSYIATVRVRTILTFVYIYIYIYIYICMYVCMYVCMQSIIKIHL